MSMRVLLTGANGFVGSMLCDVLASAGYVVRAALRTDRPVAACVAEYAVIGDIDSKTDWTDVLRGVDFVVHLAARVHVIGGATSSRHLYMETNADGTERLARAAASAGVRRLVFLSSVKVNGEAGCRPYTAADVPRPQDAYGESKWAAEKALTEIGAKTSMEWVVVRSPLVYGPGVGANFRRLMAWVDRGWPIPLGAVKNKRSLVSTWNLCEFLRRTLVHPAAPRRTWMISDGYDVSTPELITRIGVAMGRRVRLWPIPIAALRVGGALSGRSPEIARLCESLTVDIRQTVQDLQWSPAITHHEALERTVEWYMRSGARR